MRPGRGKFCCFEAWFSFCVCVVVFRRLFFFFFVVLQLTSTGLVPPVCCCYCVSGRVERRKGREQRAMP